MSLMLISDIVFKYTDNTALIALKIIKTLAVSILVIQVLFARYNSVYCLQNPTMGQMYGTQKQMMLAQPLYKMRPENLNDYHEIPTMRLHERGEMYLVFLWLLLKVPSLINYIYVSSHKIDLKSIMQIFEHINNSNESPLGKYEMFKAFYHDCIAKSPNLSPPQMTKYLVIQSLTSLLVSAGALLYMKSTIDELLPIKYYFIYKNPEVFSKTMTMCYWKAAYLSRFIFPAYSYSLLIIGSIALIELVSEFGNGYKSQGNPSLVKLVQINVSREAATFLTKAIRKELDPLLEKHKLDDNFGK